MNKDKKRVLLIAFAIFAVLLALLFIDVSNSRIVSSIALAILAVATFLLIKRRISLSINKIDVLILSSVVAVIYVILKEMTGIFFKFVRNPYYHNERLMLTLMLPTLIIIIAIEVIRYVLLSQKIKLVGFITYLSCVIAEVLIYSNIAGITSFNKFMDLVGLTLFPAISANIYYHYISKRYGMLPNIVYRVITTLYIYFVPTSTGMSDALDSCIRVMFPILMLAFISVMFEKKPKKAIQKGKKLGGFITVLTIIFIISIAMLISCQFKFGAIVIATESMTGEINKGDMIIYERYDGQKIEEGQVIVFLEKGSKIVHRVVKIEVIGGETRYYTKGDANENIDLGYRTEEDIFGLTDMKIAYIGFPTLWLRELLKN